jgi:hypothetical protein
MGYTCLVLRLRMSGFIPSLPQCLNFLRGDKFTSTLLSTPLTSHSKLPTGTSRWQYLGRHQLRTSHLILTFSRSYSVSPTYKQYVHYAMTPLLTYCTWQATFLCLVKLLVVLPQIRPAEAVIATQTVRGFPQSLHSITNLGHGYFLSCYPYYCPLIIQLPDAIQPKLLSASLNKQRADQAVFTTKRVRLSRVTAPP